MKEKKQDKNKNAGITLIALVITIVVLIILAVVAVNLSIGSNGLFNKAKTAKEQYQNAEEYEGTEIAKTANEIDNYIDNSRDTVTIPKEEYEQLKNANSYSTTETVIGTWTDGKTKVYKKTIFAVTPNGNDKVVYGLEDLNIKQVIKLDGITHRADGIYTCTNTAYNSSDVTSFYFDGSFKNIYISTNKSWYFNQNCIITIEYIKNDAT